MKFGVFELADTPTVHSLKNFSSLLEEFHPSADFCTAIKQYCDIIDMMTGLTVEQKKTIKFLYKTVRKIASLKHISRF